MKLRHFRGLKTGQISKNFQPRARAEPGYDLGFRGKIEKSCGFLQKLFLLDLLRPKFQKLKKLSLDSLPTFLYFFKVGLFGGLKMLTPAS